MLWIEDWTFFDEFSRSRRSFWLTPQLAAIQHASRRLISGQHARRLVRQLADDKPRATVHSFVNKFYLLFCLFLINYNSDWLSNSSFSQLSLTCFRRCRSSSMTSDGPVTDRSSRSFIFYLPLTCWRVQWDRCSWIFWLSRDTFRCFIIYYFADSWSKRAFSDDRLVRWIHLTSTILNKLHGTMFLGLFFDLQLNLTYFVCFEVTFLVLLNQSVLICQAIDDLFLLAAQELLVLI